MTSYQSRLKADQPRPRYVTVIALMIGLLGTAFFAGALYERAVSETAIILSK